MDFCCRAYVNKKPTAWLAPLLVLLSQNSDPSDPSRHLCLALEYDAKCLCCGKLCTPDQCPGQENTDTKDVHHLMRDLRTDDK
ncbi:hypothetical protein RUM44_006014 [Polyplax serrata]|uniref:Secreted protein n=1 Tax=Polyplax serrata TaxID=468196 RepID=A0ABR1B0B7_POLSC